MHRRAAGLAGVVLVVLSGPGLATEARDAPRPGSKHRLVLVGAWVQPGCVLTGFTPDVGSQSATVECTGVASYSGQLTGYARQRIRARASATATTATIVADISGRTSGDLCGSLHLEPEEGVVADGAATGQGPITSGTGDFRGAKGWYDATGIGAGGVAQGGYRITLELPGPPPGPPAPGAVPCVPPVPGTGG